MLNDYLTTAEAAEVKKVTVAYIARLIRQKRLKAQKKGGVYFILREDLDRIAPPARPRGRPWPKKS
ncbi:MAG: helix-turn-helix domain-containing protein [Anaerolineales bacterium]|nr:helix-turn-helix domain-containing protein [Anaerolineales bacterium]